MSYETIDTVSPDNPVNFLSAVSSIIAEKTEGEASQVISNGNEVQVSISYPSRGGFDLVLSRVDDGSSHEFNVSFVNNDEQRISRSLWSMSGPLSHDVATRVVIAKSKNSFSVAFNGGFTSYQIGPFLTIADNGDGEFVALVFATSNTTSVNNFTEIRSHGSGFNCPSRPVLVGSNLFTSLIRFPDIYGGSMFNDLYVVFSSPLAHTRGEKLQIENNIFLLLNQISANVTNSMTLALKISDRD